MAQLTRHFDYVHTMLLSLTPPLIVALGNDNPTTRADSNGNIVPTSGSVNIRFSGYSYDGINALGTGLIASVWDLEFAINQHEGTVFESMIAWQDRVLDLIQAHTKGGTKLLGSEFDVAVDDEDDSRFTVTIPVRNPNWEPEL